MYNNRNFWWRLTNLELRER